MTCTVTSLMITVAVVMSLCHTSLNSPGGDINSPRGRAAFHPNLQYPPKIFPSEIQIFLTNYPIKFPPFSNKLPVVPQMPNFLQFLMPLNSQYFNQDSHGSPQVPNFPQQILSPPKFTVAFTQSQIIAPNPHLFSLIPKFTPQIPTFPQNSQFYPPTYNQQLLSSRGGSTSGAWKSSTLKTQRPGTLTLEVVVMLMMASVWDPGML